ncbi:hypothetical protein [Budvicia aquatica]|uniref:hypothetical protein n=1 Tax=Budvicia aquatica TaxID=82979 RepID=UPI00207F8311|nr:hypothetical protein [Budvicia aquatica]GKX52216.1 hypothetical protein SOASR029_25250 [Budvicia aquatica]
MITKRVLLSVFLLIGIKCAGAAPVNVVNLTEFTGIEPYMQFKDGDACVYMANVETNTQKLTILGVSKPIKQWRFVVQQKKCGDIFDNVSLIGLRLGNGALVQ